VIELIEGSVLGHYKIIRRLGQGGMGEVYEAEDQKLGRHVAIKILPEATRQSVSALERFWREARAASSLNHPSICTIYELNESGDSPFIVMELLEGNSLDKLFRGQAMPFARLLDLGIQVSDALDAAHRKGILHRDIKPANIFLTNTGQAKILDFGLAKLEGSPDAGPADLTADLTADAPQLPRSLTNPGSALGTVAYMSPEQACGEALDARSDVFSLGVVLYELATGRPPFSGATSAVVFDKILNHAPTAPIELNPALPAEFQILINKALEKDRELRCQSAAELRADLKRLQRSSGSGRTAAATGTMAAASGSAAANSHPSSGAIAVSDSSSGQRSGAASAASGPAAAAVSEPVLPTALPQKSRAHIWIAAAVLLVGAAAFTAWRLWPQPQPFTTFGLHQMTNGGNIESVAMSADGRYLAEVKNDKGQRTLWVRNIPTNTEAQILPAFANPYVGLAFTPDGNNLYFTRPTEQSLYIRDLYQISVLGGTPRQIVHNVDSQPSFSPDGSRMVYLRQTPELKDHLTEIHIADRNGSNDQLMYSDAETAGFPVWSPDGNSIVWSTISNPGSALFILDIASKKVSQIPAPRGIAYNFDIAWLPDSRSVLVTYNRDNSDRLQIASVVIKGNKFQPVTNDLNAYQSLALSSDGHTLATVLTNRETALSLYKANGGPLVSSVPLRTSPLRFGWLDEKKLVALIPQAALTTLDPITGTTQTIDVGDLKLASAVAVCPGGPVVLPAIPKGVDHTVLYRINPDGSGATALNNEGIVRFPVCMADGKSVNYATYGSGRYTAWNVPISGGAPRKLFDAQGGNPVRFSVDGHYALNIKADNTESETLAFELRDLSTPNPIRTIIADQRFAFSAVAFSPDMKAIAYSIHQGGDDAILLQPLDGSPTQLLTDFAPHRITDFEWSPSGNQLAVLRTHATSDIVLITDQTGKQAR
jgi:serine/threonine protein kinase/Tol biopolymer transport system component